MNFLSVFSVLLGFMNPDPYSENVPGSRCTVMMTKWLFRSIKYNSVPCLIYLSCASTTRPRPSEGWRRAWTPTRWSYWSNYYHTYHTGTYHTKEPGPLPGGATGTATTTLTTQVPTTQESLDPYQVELLEQLLYYHTYHTGAFHTREPGPLPGGATGAPHITHRYLQSLDPY